MKELEKKADELIDNYYWMFGDGYTGTLHILCAIHSVKHAIEVLENLKEQLDIFKPYEVDIILDEQIELKKILENRL